MIIFWLIAILAAVQAGPTKTNNSKVKIDWNQDCGTSRKITTRIVGGQAAPTGDWPWMAAIIYRGRLRCGGTLISDRHILTAARCINRLMATSITVRLGQDSLSETEKEAEYTVEEVIANPDYDIESKQDDIAILKLAQSVRMSEEIHRICLPPTNQKPEKKIGYIAGWGFTENQGQLSDDLQEIEVPIWENSLCQAALNETILQSQLCAGRIAGGADSCNGDAGGPLMIANEFDKWELTGIVLHGSTCGEASNPSVYTRISSHLDWINEQVTGTKSDDTRNQQKGDNSPSKIRRCGLPTTLPKNRKKRLVGGDPAEEGKWPWQAALLDKFGTQFCGAVLITNRFVLTSATCASRGNASDIQVRLGGYDVLNHKMAKSMKLPVAKIHISENYRRSGSQIFNDIALLELSSVVTFSDDILHICLPQKKLSLDGRMAYVTSWGSTSKTTEFTDVVNEIQLPIWNHEECKETYDVWGVEITEDQICAGDKNGGKDACTADRGGPLVYQQSNGQWAVIGIVSFSKSCADPGIPGVYTRVNNYKEWIQSKVLST